MIKLVKTDGDTPVRNDVEGAISRHRAAMQRFELLMNESGEGAAWRRNVREAAKREAEARAWLLAYPCNDAEDMRLKAGYLAVLMSATREEFTGDEILVLLRSFEGKPPVPS